MYTKSSMPLLITTAIALFLCIISMGATINSFLVEAQSTTTTSTIATTTTIIVNATNTTTSAPSDFVPWTWKPIFVVVMLACLLLSLAFDLLNNIAGLFIISAVFHLSGIISEKEFFVGFSNGGVASLALIYVLTDPIKSLPIVRRGANYIFAGEKGAKYWPLIKTLIFCLVSSTVLPNKPQVALLVPIVVETCRASGLHPQFLLQPVNIAVHLANYFSMSSSSNLVTEGLMEAKGLPQVGFFEFAKTAVVASIGTCAAMVALAGLMFESVLPADISELEEENKQDFTSFHCMMHVMSRCRFIGRTWGELFDELPSEYLRKVKVMKIWRASGRVVGDATAIDETMMTQSHDKNEPAANHDDDDDKKNNATLVVVTTNTNDEVQRNNFNKYQPLLDEMKNLPIERGDEILVAGFPEHLRSFHHLAGFAWVGLSPLELGASNDDQQQKRVEPSSNKKNKTDADDGTTGHELEIVPTTIFEQQESCQNENEKNNVPQNNNNASTAGRLEYESSATFAERDNNGNNTATATSRGDDNAVIGPDKPASGDEATTTNAMTVADSPDFPKSSRRTQRYAKPEESNINNDNNNNNINNNIPVSVTATPSLLPRSRRNKGNIDDDRLQRRDTIVVFGKEASLTDQDDTNNNTQNNSDREEGEQLQQLGDQGQDGIILEDNINNNGSLQGRQKQQQQQPQQQQQDPFSVLPASVSYRVKRSNISRRLQAFESDSAEFADNFIVTLSAENRWVGKALGSSHFVSRLNCFVMGIRTHDGIHLPPFQFHVHRLAEGDQLLIRVGKSFFARHSQSGEFMSIESVSHEKLVHSVQESYWKVPDWIPFNVGTSILPTTSQHQHGSSKTSKTTSKNPTPAISSGRVHASESNANNIIVSAFPSSPSTKHGTTTTTKTTGLSPLLLSPKQQQDQAQLFTSRYITIPKWWNSLSLVILLGVIAATMGGVALNTSAIIGIFVLVAIGIQSPREAVLAIDWVVITATALSFGIGAAIANSGLSKIIANALAGSSVSGFGLVLLLSFLSGITSAFLQDTGAVQLLFPIYVRVFRERGLDEGVAAVILANGVVAGFFTSFGCSSNLIIAGPGNYRGRDFTTYGFPIFVVWHILVSAMEYAVYF